jgi:hypothetical protein
MDDQARYIETLQQALHLLGNERRLAAYLRVSPEILSGWLRRDAPVPLESYLDVLDVVGEESFLSCSTSAA